MFIYGCILFSTTEFETPTENINILENTQQVLKFTNEYFSSVVSEDISMKMLMSIKD